MEVQSFLFLFALACALLVSPIYIGWYACRRGILFVLPKRIKNAPKEKPMVSL